MGVAATHSSKRFARVVCCLGKSSSSPPALRAKAELTTSWAQQFLLHTTTIACSEGQTQFLSLDQTCLSPNFDCATLLPKFSDEHKQSWRNTIEEEFSRRNAAIDAVAAYCHFQEGGAAALPRKRSSTRQTSPMPSKETSPQLVAAEAEKQALSDAMLLVFTE